jgi:hypothetical protein
MSISNDVQGLALALYGAFAGSHLQRLTAQAATQGNRDVAQTLLDLQPSLLKQNLSNDETWTDTVLGHLGLNAQNPAYLSAKVWFLLQSALNRPREDVVNEAVQFLLTTAVSPNADPKYLSLAKSFRSDVVNGVEWSEAQKQVATGALFADISTLRAQVPIVREEQAKALKFDVQGLAVALFGGYAGGHFADLLEQAQSIGVPVLARGLAGLQSQLLQRDLASSDTWSDFVLSNLGLGKEHAAYPAAKAWFSAQTSLGRDRGEITHDAVQYLQQLTTISNPDARFAPVGESFTAKVNEGVRWSLDSSAQGGARTLDLATLQKQITAAKKPPVSDSVLKDVLASYFEALQTQKTFLEGGNPAKSALIEAAEIAAESAIRDVLNNGSFVYNQDEASSGQTKAANDLENTAEASARTAWTQALSGIKDMVASAKSQLDAVSPQAAPLVDSVARANITMTQATETLYQAEASLFTQIEKGATGFTAGSIAFNYDLETRVFELLEMRNDGDYPIAIYAGGSWSPGSAYRASADIFKPLSEVYALAYSEYLNIEASLTQLLRPLERLNEDLTSAITVDDVDAYTMLTEEADKYLAAFSSQQDAELLIAKAQTALSQVTQLRTGDVSTDSLQKAVQSARQAVIAQDYNFQDLVDGSTVKASSKGDLYDVAKLNVAGAKARVSEFGLQGDDALIVFGYQLAASKSGNDSVLEFSVTQQGADTLVSFELSPNSFGATTSGTTAGFSITLTGIDATTLAYADHLILG